MSAPNPQSHKYGDFLYATPFSHQGGGARRHVITTAAPPQMFQNRVTHPPKKGKHAPTKVFFCKQPKLQYGIDFFLSYQSMSI